MKLWPHQFRLYLRLHFVAGHCFQLWQVRSPLTRGPEAEMTQVKINTQDKLACKLLTYTPNIFHKLVIFSPAVVLAKSCSSIYPYYSQLAGWDWGIV